MPAADDKPKRVYLDLTHLGRHVTGIERVSIEQFQNVAFDNAEIVPVRSSGLLSMIFRQQVVLPLLALLHPNAHFVFPGFPPSPLFALARDRVLLYVHDTFLITRHSDLSTKARLYTAPQFRFDVTRLKHFFVNSEKTKADLRQYAPSDAVIRMYRPSVANPFKLSSANRATMSASPQPLRLVSLGTIEPRKNYAASLAILEALRRTHYANTELHIIGRAGWGEDATRVASAEGVTVHGYLASDDVKRVMESCDVYLCTSHDEGLGLPLLEAQFAGLPVVAPDQAVFREVLGDSGTLIDPANAQSAANAIVACVSAPSWRATRAAAATDNVARWNGEAAKDLFAAKTIFALPAKATAIPTAARAA